MFGGFIFQKILTCVCYLSFYSVKEFMDFSSDN